MSEKKPKESKKVEDTALPLPIPQDPNKDNTKCPQDPLPPVAIIPVREKSAISQDAADELALSQYESVSKSGFPTDKILATMSTFAKHCVETGQMPSTINTVAKAIMVFQAGRELNIPPVEALNSFYFVNNKLSLYGATVIRRIRSVASIEYGKCTDTEAAVTIIRKDDGTELSAKVTKTELEKRGQWKGTMTAHPETMLIYKAVGRIVRHIAPEAVGSMGVEGDYVEESAAPAKRRGRVVASDTEVIPEENHAPEAVEIPPAIEVARKYSLEAITKRLKELDVEIDPKATKGMLAAKLVEKLHEIKDQKNG